MIKRIIKKMIKKSSLIIALLCFVLAMAGAIEIIDFNNIKFLLDFDYTQSLTYSIMEGAVGWQAPDVGIEMGAENEQFTLALGLDLSPIFKEEYQKVIKECYLAYALSEKLVLQAGQFKNPFGRENSKGKSKRPYPDHSISSGEIAPGYSRGAALSGKKLTDYLDFEAGLFASGKTTKEENNLLKLLPAGNLTLDFKLGENMEMEFAYSGFVDLDFTSLLKYQLAQGFALQLDFNLGSKNDISLFGEFLERYANSLALNGNPYWTHGIFGSASWRLKDYEPFATYEHFLADTAVQTTGDTMVVCGGVNWHPPGGLVLRLYYRWDYLYLTAASWHLAGFMCNYRL